MNSNLCLVALVFTPLLGVHLLAGPIAADRLAKRVAIECHQTSHQGLFKIEHISFLPEGAKKWTLSVIQSDAEAEPKPKSNCLHQGALLSVVIKPNTIEYLLNTPPGELIQAKVKIKAPKSTLQMQGFDVQAYWFSHGISGLAALESAQIVHQQAQGLSPVEWIQRIRFSTGQWITEELKNHPQQGLVLALVTGDQGLISADDREVFNTTGIAHLVAISGLHITMLAGLTCWLLSQLWRRQPRLAEHLPAGLAGQYAGLFIALIYGLLAGWGVPAQRTVLMQAGFLIAHLHPGRISVWNVYWAAMLLSLLLDPWVMFDIGFYLSFGAVGLLIFSGWAYTPFEALHPSRLQQLRGYAHTALKAQYVATLGLVPFCAALFHQQSLISPLINALSIPWMSFVSTPLSMLGTLSGNSWLLHLAAQSLEVQQIWLNTPAGLELATWPLPRQPAWVYAASGLGVLWVLIPKGILPRWPGFIALGTLLLPVPKAESGEFWMDVLDVGQGTAVVIRTQNHSLLYDTGPAFNEQSNSARRVILPWLKSEGVKQLNQLWLSHDDADHTGGAMVLLQHHSPKQMVSHLEDEHALVQQAKSIQTQNLDCKTLPPWEWDGVQFTPISPPSAPAGADSIAKESRSTPETKDLLRDNNQSCMLKIENRNHSVLLSGDIELAAEQALVHPIHTGLMKPDYLKASVLYAPHHGSKTSSSQAFLDAVNPEYVVIQSGWKNRYKHPHPEVLKRYEDRGLTVLGTAQVGALQLRFRREYEELIIQSALQNRLRYWHLHESSAFQR